MKTIMLAAITLDGRIARNDAELTVWTSKEDKEMFTRETKKAGVMVMGRKTYDTFPKPLPSRLHIVMTGSLEGKENIEGVVEFTDKSPKEILDDLGSRGFETVMITGGSKINSLFLDAGLMDEVWLTVEPQIFGEGVSVFADPIKGAEVKLKDVEKINDDCVLLKYRVLKPKA